MSSSVAQSQLELRERVPPSVLSAVREVALVRAALALIAVHILDDNFLQPQPGTAAADHLLSGLVPTSIVLGVALAYPRLRAGLRAVTALLLGTFGILAGAAEAGYYTLERGPSGDDYTGLLAIPAGVLLVALGAITLWRSRKRNDGLWRRYARRALLTLAGLFVFVELVGGLALGYVSTHVMRAEVPVANLGTSYENVSFTTSDGLLLEGWYIPSRNGAAVIAFPGRRGPQKHARMLARNGYGSIDLLKLIDSNDRGRRFARTGLMSEPGMRHPMKEETEAAHGIRYDRPHKPGVLAQRARELRSRETPSERALWLALRSRQVCGVHFCRQVVIGGRWICDFVAAERQLTSARALARS